MAEEIWIPDTRPILLRYEERKKTNIRKVTDYYIPIYKTYSDQILKL